MTADGPCEDVAMTERVPLAEAMIDLIAGRVAWHPPWFQPGPPMEAWLIPEAAGALLVVWDPSRARAERAVVYDEAKLRAELPRLVTSGVVWARDIVPIASVPADAVRCGRALITRLASTLALLRARPELCLERPLGPDATDHLSHRVEVGWRSFVVSKGVPIRVARYEDDAIEAMVSAMLFASDELAPLPIDPAVIMKLDEGERRWIVLRDSMRRGEIGWRVHVDRVVVDLEGDLFSAAFHGLQVTYSHPFARGHVDGDMLTRTLTDAAPSPIVPLLPGQQAALRASVRSR